MAAFGTLRSNLSMTWPASSPLTSVAGESAFSFGMGVGGILSAALSLDAVRFAGPKHPDVATLAISTLQQIRLRTAPPLDAWFSIREMLRRTDGNGTDRQGYLPTRILP